MAQESIQFIGLTPEQFKQDFLNEAKSFITDLFQNVKANEPLELLTRKQVAKMLNVNLTTIHNWTKKGTLTSYGIEGRVYYKRTEIEQSIIQLN